MNALSLILVIAFALVVNAQVREFLEKKATFGGKVQNWIQQRSRKVSGKEMITVRFVIKQDESKIKSLERELLILSTPGSPTYGKWLSKDEVKQRLAASSDSIKAVTDFLAASGVTEYTLSPLQTHVSVSICTGVKKNIYF